MSTTPSSVPSDPFAGIALPRVTAPEAIASALREMILSGALPPGTPLRETHIGAALGVSRNTLREALRIMGNERLVTHRAHHGVVVAFITPEDVRDIFAVRRTLEGAGAACAPDATKAQVAAIEAARVERDAAAKAEEWDQAFDANLRFHAAIVALNGSSRLDGFFLTVLRELRLAYQRLHGVATERLSPDPRHHRAIAKAIAAGDGEAARKAVLDHLAHGERVLMDLLPQQGVEAVESA